uniref:arylsulfatase F isoform X2 n=1 Tax=Macaca mulatta TaxID=9544 RepID=UPI0010A23524|nr:arylsulfatase F isoform X2 [Macaca mulatta]
MQLPEPGAKVPAGPLEALPGFRFLLQWNRLFNPVCVFCQRQQEGSPSCTMRPRSPLVFMSLVCTFLNTCQAHRVHDDKPNIVLIMVDDLGIGDLGCYGNDTIRTPHIDRLAREGVRLTQHISAASLCSPSRSAFLTGRYPIRSGMVSSGNRRVVHNLAVPAGLPLNETTFAALLKKQGYSTGLIGKWHQGLNCDSRSDHCHHPYNYGFDYYYGMPFTLVDSCWPDPSRNAELTFESQLWLCVQLVAIAVLTLTFGKLSGWVSVPLLLIFSMILFIFLLGYAWFSSYTSPLYWDCLLMRGHEITEQPMKAERAGSIMVKEAISFLESKHGLYGDNVEEMDSMMGKILDAIDDFGLRNNTIVYFTSDHGGHLEARRGHAQLGGWNGIYKGGKGMGGWEGGIRVPGIVRWPGKVPAGRLIKEPTSLMDILPTVASVSGGSLPQDRVIDGRDLMPLLQGNARHSEHEFLFHYCGSQLHAVRWIPKDDSGAVWKAHYVTPVFQPPEAGGCYVTSLCRCFGEQVTYHNPPLLFDLSRDPSESTPLTPATDPLHDFVIKKVADALKEHRETIMPVTYQLSELNQGRMWLKPCCGVFPFCLCDKEEELSQSQAPNEKR